MLEGRFAVDISSRGIRGRTSPLPGPCRSNLLCRLLVLGPYRVAAQIVTGLAVHGTGLIIIVTQYAVKARQSHRTSIVDNNSHSRRLLEYVARPVPLSLQARATRRRHDPGDGEQLLAAF